MNDVRHVGIIMDGNRRFAKRLLKNPLKGHEWGKEKLKELLEWCQELDIKELTVYALSMQNFNRPEKEFKHLMTLFRDALKDLISDKDDQLSKLRVRFVGRTHLLPEDIQEQMNQIEQATKKNRPYKLNIAVAYGGREELIDAFMQMAREIKAGDLEPEDLDEQTVEKHLLVAAEPDLVIRTGGEHRISNFLLWQSSYTEFFFTETLWPEFGKEEFESMIDSFKKRHRRYGK